MKCLDSSAVLMKCLSALPFAVIIIIMPTLACGPIAVETLGPLNTSACQLFGNLGRKISSSSGDDREGAFLFQRVSVLVPRLHDSLEVFLNDMRYINPRFTYLLTYLQLANP